MSRKTPPAAVPRPALTSELMARATSSRGSSSGGRLLLSGSVYQRSASASVSRVLVAEHVGHVVEHEPLALGVLQHPAVAADRLGDQDARAPMGGQTMPVGWNCRNSMLISVAPARSASA